MLLVHSGRGLAWLGLLVRIGEKAKLLESGASSSQTPRAGTARLGSEESMKRALAWLGSDFVGAAWFYLLVF
jgi:hypothetical protein